MTMADDASTITWRLDRIEETLRDLGLRVVAVDLYARDRAELERDIAELRAAIAEEKLARQTAVDAERQARKEADKAESDARQRDVQDVKGQVDKQGTNWRQALYSGLVPGIIFLLGMLWQLRAGTGK